MKKNLKAFVRIMVVMNGKSDVFSSDLAKDSKTPIATVRDLLDFAEDEGYMTTKVRGGRVLYSLTELGTEFSNSVNRFKNIFLMEEETPIVQETPIVAEEEKANGKRKNGKNGKNHVETPIVAEAPIAQEVPVM